MVEVFRRRVIKLLVQRELLNEDFAQTPLSWKHSGFSIDNSVRILDGPSRENLAQYMARPPISLKKIRYEPFKGRVLFHTTYSKYFKQNVHLIAPFAVAVRDRFSYYPVRLPVRSTPRRSLALHANCWSICEPV